MPSEHQKKRAAKKKEAAKAKGGKKVVDEPAENGTSNGVTNGSSRNSEESDKPSNVPMTYEEELCLKLEEEARLASEARACTGVMGIHPMSRDIKIDNFSITFYGTELLQDTKLELSVGNRYALIGPNGCGKSSLLSCIGNREVPIQEHVDIYHLDREMPASEKSALE
jgi:ATP-binding cassette subfamily F protein 2